MKHKNGSLKVNISDKKDEGDIILLSKQPIHPREIIEKKAKLLEFDARTLKEIPYINIDVPIDTKESENEIMDRIIQNLPANNDSYYIDHEEVLTPFQLKKIRCKEEKSNFFQLIFNGVTLCPAVGYFKFKF